MLSTDCTIPIEPPVCFYKTRELPRFGDSKRTARYRQLCTNNWVETKNDYGFKAPFTSVQHKVTCPRCLEILIPKKELELNIMKTNLSTATLRHEYDSGREN